MIVNVDFQMFNVTLESGQYVRRTVSGVEVERRSPSADELSALTAEATDAVRTANASTIVTTAQGALATNATYLAIATPSNAQVAAQVRALTQQNNRIIRLLLSQLGDRSQLDSTS